MPNTNTKYKVRLSREQRSEFEAICRQQCVGASKLRRARILLMADEVHPDGRRPDWHIAEVVGLSERQVVRIRQQFVREGTNALDRKPRPSVPGKLDGKAEARLITLSCSSPPTGRERWTLQLFCDELVRLQVVESVCRETVRSCLKKMTSSPGVASDFASLRRIERGSSRRWRKFSTSIRRRTTPSTR
jgi:Homeodomain-like domain